MTNRRGRGRRFVSTACLVCYAKPGTPETAHNAHRMWAQRHADATGHVVRVQTLATRDYKPRPDDTR